MADYSLVPVEHQPDFENASLVPVDHNPFGDSGTVQQAQFQQPQHVDDFDPLSGEATLEFVSEKSHNATLRHVGSVGQYAKHHGIPYKR